MPYRLVDLYQLAAMLGGSSVVALLLGLRVPPDLHANAILLVVVLGMMTIEMVTAALADVRQGGVYTRSEWRNSILDKFLSLSVIVVGVGFDYIVQNVPAGFKLHHELLAMNLFTKATLIWLLLTEGWDTLGNVRAGGRARSIAPYFEFVDRLFSREKENWKSAGGKDEVPTRRHADEVLLDPYRLMKEIEAGSIKKRRRRTTDKPEDG